MATVTVETSEGPVTVEQIDMETARRLLAEARDTQPEGFQYAPDGASCFNVPVTDDMLEDNDTPLTPNDPRRVTGCLVGTALTGYGLGVLMKDHHRSSVWDLSHKVPGLFTGNGVITYLSWAQSAQDNGSTWSNAIAKAEREMAQQLAKT